MDNRRRGVSTARVAWRPCADRFDRWLGTRPAFAGTVASTFALLLCLTGAGQAAAADADPRLAIVEGGATVVDGLRSYTAVPGMRLAPGALLDTGAATTLVRVEWTDGNALDLGPASRVMLAPALAAPAGAPALRPPRFYLLRGWAKHTQTAADAGQWTPALALPGLPGVVVSHVEAQRSGVFVESGAAQLVERLARPSATLNLRAGTSASLAGSDHAQTAARPPPELLAQMPRSFRDSLARHGALFSGAPVAAKPLPDAPSFALLQDWLDAEPALQHGLARRFAPLLHDPKFRAAMLAHLSSHAGAHPEWDALVHPKPVHPRPAASAVLR